MDNTPPTFLPSTQDLHFFARNGFLHLKKVVSEEATAYLVEETWKRLPSSWSRNNPSSWVGEVTDSCHTSDLNYRRGHVKFQKGELVGDKVIMETFERDSSLGKFAQGMIGRPLRKIRVRGLYPNVPPPDATSLREYIKPHVEAHPVHIVALCYLNDVPTKSGGLLVWPGSHLDLYSSFKSKLDFVACSKYDIDWQKWSGLRPIELCGSRGDVILIHHRLFHAPSLNRSRSIRFAFLCDYISSDYLELCQQKPGKQLWEDWPSIASAVEKTTLATDFCLSPWSETEKSGISVQNLSVTARRKGEASILARMRQQGEVWLSVSDNQDSATRNDLDPCGTDITGDGVRVFINHKEINSKSQHDIIDKVNLISGVNQIRVVGINRPLWLKLICVELPLTSSRIIFQSYLDGLSPEINLSFEYSETDKTVIDSKNKFRRVWCHVKDLASLAKI